ncbi:MAG: sigma-70 family RNA polymerase sigma factor [Gemmatimonadota bacterium]|nr:sigma-70 family RNA polymerase sigma factor [Gemmatimonadota bacterium]
MTRAAAALEDSQRLSLSGVDEAELIARVLAGDRAAARALYDAHAPRVFRLVYRLAGDEELARDFTQDTFVRAFEHLGRFRGEAALSTWLHRIAVSTTLNGMRRLKRFRRETDLDEAQWLAAGADESEPDLRTRLTAAIDGLPEMYRVTLVMHDIEGYTHAEIAATLGVPEGTSKTRLHIARVRLRDALADFRKEGR